MAKRVQEPDKVKIRNSIRRLAILEAAAEAFFERGYAATSLDDVADRLGSTKGRVHHYFPTKGEIFIAIHRRALDLALNTVEPLATGPGSATERMRQVSIAHALLMMNESGFMRLSVQHAEISLATEGQPQDRSVREVFQLRKKYEALFEQIVREGIASGEFRDDDPAVLSRAALGALNWMAVWYRPDMDVDEERRTAIAESIATYITSGLRVVAVVVGDY